MAGIHLGDEMGSVDRDDALLPFVARGPDDVETPTNTGTQLFARGNVFQVAAISYTNITQQSFQ